MQWWRVPTGSSNPAQGTWGDFFVESGNPYWKGNGATAGSLFTKGTQSWYPACGYRINNSGPLGNVASRGFYWSASPYNDSSFARFLDSLSTDVNLGRANSQNPTMWAVRCVQE